ncbi:OLC1v1034324C1 [Oldenlandia corymbosa var. corymbosa]|uniref:OLC1v1034324C1 n=1 Tax=Oldenlandia corymbosa var. corymbosa TaxID=529605 RepID=A0AAV1CQG9_OLDCO|nr:OLC1v1034324C1 [Oldenlandia corymbosa var. corymbosa]
MDESFPKSGGQPHRIEASWVPSTPAKPALGKEELIHAEKQPQQSDNRSQQSQSAPGNVPPERTAAGYGESNRAVSEPAESQSYEDAMNQFDQMSQFSQLLEFVIRGGTIQGSYIDTMCQNSSSIQSQSQSQLLEPTLQAVSQTPHSANATWSPFPFDLNTPLSAMADASGLPILPSVSAISSQFEPVTPDQIKKADKVSSSNLCAAQAAEIGVQKEVSELSALQNNQSVLVENQNSTTISTVTGENFEPEMAIEEQTDLSKTPVKKPRKKKHRPKVIVEGQSRKPYKPRTPKPNNPKEGVKPKRKYVRKSPVGKPVDDVPSEGKTNEAAEEAKPLDSEDTPKGKRKYERKQKVDQPSTPYEDENMTTTDSSAAPITRRSCKRSLNFDVESQVPGGSFGQPQSDFTIHKTFQENQVLLEKTEVASVAHNLTESADHMLKDSLLVKESLASSTSSSCLSSQFMFLNQTEGTRGKCPIIFSDVTHDKQEITFKTMASDVIAATRSSSNPKGTIGGVLNQETEVRKSKRRRSSRTDSLEPRNINASGGHYNSLQAYQEIIPPNQYSKEETSNWQFPAIFKKKRSETIYKPSSSSIRPTSITTDYYAKYSMNHLVAPQRNSFPSDPAVEIDISTSKSLPTFGNAGRITRKRSKNITRVRDMKSLLETSRQLSDSYNGSGTSAQKPQTCMGALADIRATLARKKRSNRIFISSSTSNNHRQAATILSGYPPDMMRKDTLTVDAIVEKLQCLSIQEQQNALVTYQERNTWQNSIVLYQNNGAMVPFDGPFNYRKRRPRPKVDLDEETNRVWKLLLENINSEGVDGTDQQKAKWWEDEREVFRLRTESFIARMHLVQGDRRFTPWKGSVVDSVVGVFLTQNVSDHLSSSAFISMAAKFPLKSTNHYPSAQLSEERSEQSEVYNPNDISEWDGKVSNPLPDSGPKLDNEPDNSVVSPHNSAESIGQSAIRVFHCSNSSVMHTGVNHECQQINLSQDSGFINISKENDLPVTEQSGFSPESSAGTSSQDSLSHDNHQIPNEDRGHEFLSKVQKQEVHIIYEGSNAPSSSESELDNSDSSNLMDEAAKINPSASTAKKRKANGKENNDTVDWDQLRKLAQANGKRERTVETMDSVDWEAVRCADVDEIAQTIKERGMNNMLAARIKDFLNRIVREYESIDLEWLRDIPPDRAKEFLLSIRGLGLKSVECVRLLTLHHLAFPVDTNVGRIAVRLGWVPLQPLPESLQLHLLELYPVLESIQKYLWPRLCKLDQRTLYELHYQLITFGKVFCTKSKPNCNACPMRAECRHFASAYASARLALPAPEEKSIISATENESASRISSKNINHLQLPQPEPNHQLEASLQVRSFGSIVEEPATPDPIIEEPATPEPENTKVAETDIEDSFCEDAEIPTIKLNLEELNQTLQNYFEQNIQVQEGEISKALVVLNADAASIPMPKLKNINRLRTEHQVYELPDTHPLLQGFDKREPDDPSHYLLAIWTPGETVNSIQPPEGSCGFQDSGKLCDRETCFSCNSIREAKSQTVRGTLLIPCRTAMRGSFPLNGTYFQVNEMFADHESSLNPIDVPREWLWNLPRRTVYFGTSVPTIFKGLTQPEIQYCFWRGFPRDSPILLPFGAYSVGDSVCKERIKGIERMEARRPPILSLPCGREMGITFGKFPAFLC